MHGVCACVHMDACVRDNYVTENSHCPEFVQDPWMFVAK